MVVGINISRGTPWYRRSREPGWFVVGGRRAAERLNKDWLERQDLQHLADDLSRLGERLRLFDDEPYVLCKREKYCSVCASAAFERPLKSHLKGSGYKKALRTVEASCS